MANANVGTFHPKEPCTINVQFADGTAGNFYEAVSVFEEDGFIIINFSENVIAARTVIAAGKWTFYTILEDGGKPPEAKAT